MATEIANSITDSSPEAEVALFVPYVFIEAAQQAVQGKLQIGAEVSMKMMIVMNMMLLLLDLRRSQLQTIPVSCMAFCCVPCRI